ncbi:hypothetical protein PR202_ga02489 [Eleusine coracana subsp. coracana]|uniref:Anion-transporting ATPase-like domain-containing protein n=1 Tax=Eleusine coracana subsp. coracana TaxID=191504 RepID=A0AAV5BKY5_ELECO|nr:hypothetical protein PR202_ga02489 [Eleusine coracana subsp. coracana]
MVIACSGGAGPPPKLVTFLCKGGSGKTAAVAVAAQYYASEGFKTCLAMKPQDPTAEQLMGCKIGNSLTEFATNLSAIKLLSSKVKCFAEVILSSSCLLINSKMLFEPLDRLKKADARANFTQGVLEGVVD